MLPRVGNLLSWPRDNFESTDYFFLGFTVSTSTLAYVSLSSLCSNWIDHQALDIILILDNPKYMWRQIPLDLIRDSHTQHKQQLQNMAKVFPFILKAKHKTLYIKRAWVELENSAEKQSTWASIDRASQIYIVNLAEHSISTLYINILWANLKLN